MKDFEPVKPEKVIEKVETNLEKVEEEIKPVTLLTELDAYISERMKSQPKRLEEIEVVTKEEKLGIHRLSLPDYFEEQSYDCTIGNTCKFHGWVKKEVMFDLQHKMDRWEQAKHGKFVFRWLLKSKRALDHSVNVRGWFLVNRSYFPDAPRILYSVNGGVENGDAILGFMPVKKALQLRTEPSDKSISRIRSEESKHEGNPNFYKPKLSPEQVDGDDFAPVDALQEGRDF